MSESPYVPVEIGPDAARDARVAKRRAEDARKAGVALDRVLALADEFRRAYHEGWADGYKACELHHNCHYGVPEAEQ